MRLAWHLILKMMVITIVGMSFITTKAIASLEEEYSEGDWSGRVDWQEGFIYASGIGTANMSEMINDVQAEQVSRTTAKHLAYRALYEIVGRIAIDASSIYRKQLMEDDILKIETRGQIENAQIWKEEFSWTPQNSPRAIVTVRMPINGGLSRATSGWYIRQQAIPRFEGSGIPTDETFTGLIVDARGVNVRPCICPKILTDNGRRVVYGPESSDKSTADGMGYTAYAGSMEDARKNARAGNKPLIVKALDVSGQNHGDLIISQNDAIMVLGADIRGDFLKECKVIILVR